MSRYLRHTHKHSTCSNIIIGQTCVSVCTSSSSSTTTSTQHQWIIFFFASLNRSFTHSLVVSLYSFAFYLPSRAGIGLAARFGLSVLVYVIVCVFVLSECLAADRNIQYQISYACVKPRYQYWYFCVTELWPGWLAHACWRMSIFFLR